LVHVISPRSPLRTPLLGAAIRLMAVAVTPGEMRCPASVGFLVTVFAQVVDAPRDRPTKSFRRHRVEEVTQVPHIERRLSVAVGFSPGAAIRGWGSSADRLRGPHDVDHYFAAVPA
jgi:hypothetical protein